MTEEGGRKGEGHMRRGRRGRGPLCWSLCMDDWKRSEIGEWRRVDDLLWSGRKRKNGQIKDKKQEQITDWQRRRNGRRILLPPQILQRERRKLERSSHQPMHTHNCGAIEVYYLIFSSMHNNSVSLNFSSYEVTAIKRVCLFGFDLEQRRTRDVKKFASQFEPNNMRLIGCCCC